MVKYTKSIAPAMKEKAASAMGERMTVHFKNIVEVAAAIKGKLVTRAKQYLQNVLEHKEAIAIHKSNGGRGRHAQVSAAVDVEREGWIYGEGFTRGCVCVTRN
jgi:large subunit ribosomal protein L17e